MDITPYVDGLRRDLLAAADSAGPEARAVVERLGFALEPAVRLAVMEAVAQAAAEISAELPSGSIDVRLAGRDLGFVVTRPPSDGLPAAPEAASETEDDGTVARVTLRIPESLKTRAEELAASTGHSLNTWLVGVVRAAATTGHTDLDLSSFPLGSPRGGKRMSGWI